MGGGGGGSGGNAGSIGSGMQGALGDLDSSNTTLFIGGLSAAVSIRVYKTRRLAQPAKCRQCPKQILGAGDAS